LFTWSVSAEHLSAQGQYAPVTAADVVALKLNHYFTPDNQAHQPDFEWTFTETEFALKKKQGDLPADLLRRMLPDSQTAAEIRGKWKLVDRNGLHLVLTEIKAGDRTGNKAAFFPIYKTAPTVVRIGEPQYVFGIGL
jgi:hypothetical protein